jgi:hypothetical protein
MMSGSVIRCGVALTMNRVSKFLRELVRRKVVRLVGAYTVIFWALAQGYASLYPAFGLPDWSLRVFVITGIALAPVLALLSWKYDLAPPQLVRDAKDIEESNPGLSWAQRRHRNTDGGFILLKWSDHDGAVNEKRYFKPVTIGRGVTNDVQFEDDRVSRHHAVIWAEGGGWHVRDLDSANGTFVNRARVDGAVPLPPSCEIRFHANGPALDVHIDTPTPTRVT